MDYLNVDLNNDDFISWIADNHLLCYKYREYLLDIGVLEDDSYLEKGNDYLEIGKGLYDSISNRATNRSSLFGETMHATNTSFVLLEEQPIVIGYKGIMIPKQKTILTHNPHICYDISNWHRIHNAGEYDISVGMYGTIYDEDIVNKIKQIELLAKEMTDDYTIDYDIDKGNYFCSLNSKRKTLKRIRVLSR